MPLTSILLSDLTSTEKISIPVVNVTCNNLEAHEFWSGLPSRLPLTATSTMNENSQKLETLQGV